MPEHQQPAPSMPPQLRWALRRRGLSLRAGDLAPDGLWLGNLPPRAQDQVYQQLRRYSFRLVLRDVIRLGQDGAVDPAALTRHAALQAVQQHLRAMQRLGLVRLTDAGHATLQVPAHNMGLALEWLVAEVLRRELGFCVARNVPLRGGQTGGDLDVVALAEGLLLYVEVKSGPPKHLMEAHVAAFLDRVEALAPHGAIFYNDTELRMKDKVVPLFAEQLRLRGSPRQPRRLQRELFTAGPDLLIANAHPDITANLAHCVSHLLRWRGVQLAMDPGAGVGPEEGK